MNRHLTDLELLESKLQDWQIDRHYEVVDIMGFLCEIREVLEKSNIPVSGDVVCRIVAILDRRISRGMQPATTHEVMIENLLADPGRRIRPEQIG